MCTCKLDLTAQHCTFQIYCLYIRVANFQVLKELSVISITLRASERSNSVYSIVWIIFNELYFIFYIFTLILMLYLFQTNVYKGKMQS